MITCAPAGMVTSPTATGEVAYRNVECGTGASKRRSSSSARRISSGIGAEGREFGGTIEERDEPVSEQARGRVVPGDDELEDGREQLLLGELIVSVAGRDQVADEIVARRRSFRRDQRPRGTPTTASEASRARSWAAGVSAGLRSTRSSRPKRRAIGDCDSEELADDRERQTAARSPRRGRRLAAVSRTRATSSRSSFAMCCTCGRRASTRLFVNALATRRRSRVWSGGSTASMWRANAGPGNPSDTTLPLELSAACMSFDRRGSLSAAFASSYRTMHHASTPSSSATRWTGAERAERREGRDGVVPVLRVPDRERIARRAAGAHRATPTTRARRSRPCRVRRQ